MLMPVKHNFLFSESRAAAAVTDAEAANANPPLAPMNLINYKNCH